MKCFIINRSQKKYLNKLQDLFYDLVFVYGSGKDPDYGDSNSRISISFNNIPQTDLYYLFSIYNGNYGIWKINNGIINQTPVIKSSEDYGGIYERTGTSHTLYYYNGNYSVGTSSYGGSLVEGGSLILVNFPNHDEDDIDKILKESIFNNLYNIIVVSAVNPRKTNVENKSTIILCFQGSGIGNYTTVYNRNIKIIGNVGTLNDSSDIITLSGRVYSVFSLSGGD